MIGIYHSRDFDGIACGAIMKKAYPDIKLVGYHYKEPFDMNMIVGQEVIMADVSLEMDQMRQVAELAETFTWIDHHASAIQEIKPILKDMDITPFLDDKLSACELAWKVFFHRERMPLAISLLGRYDRNDRSDMEYRNNDILPFQYGMRLYPLDVDKFPEWVFADERDFDSYNSIQETIAMGKGILEYQRQQNVSACKLRAFEATIGGLRAICCNGVPFNAQSFESVWDPDKYDLMAPFAFNGKEYEFSLYTEKDDIDCSAVAKRFNGGGHKKAAGFKLPLGRRSELFLGDFHVLNW